MSSQRERHFDTGIGAVQIFVKMGLNDAIVIQSDSFTEGVLGDLEAAIDIAPQGRSEIEPDGEGQGLRAKTMEQRLFMSGLGKGEPELLPDMEFESSPG